MTKRIINYSLPQRINMSKKGTTEYNSTMFLIGTSRYDQYYNKPSDLVPFDIIANMDYRELTEYLHKKINFLWKCKNETEYSVEIWLYILSKGTVQYLVPVRFGVLKTVNASENKISEKMNKYTVKDDFLIKIRKALEKARKDNKYQETELNGTKHCLHRNGDYIVLNIDGIEVHLKANEIDMLYKFLQTYSQKNKPQTSKRKKIKIRSKEE